MMQQSTHKELHNLHSSSSKIDRMIKTREYEMSTYKMPDLLREAYRILVGIPTRK
jgi:hypothetical protein